MNKSCGYDFYYKYHKRPCIKETNTEILEKMTSTHELLSGIDIVVMDKSYKNDILRCMKCHSSNTCVFSTTDIHDKPKIHVKCENCGLEISYEINGDELKLTFEN